MKTLFRGLFVSAVFLMTASFSVSAATSINENISFNYQDNTFSITSPAASGEAELTVSLLKGEWTTDKLSQLTASDFYYIGQTTGDSYDDFGVLGMKYDSNGIEPGVYTLVTSGDGNNSVEATKLVIGNAVNKDNTLSDHVHSGLTNSSVEFGTVDATLRVYNEDSTYAYVCVGSFEYKASAEMGFMFQRTQGDEVKKAYTKLDDLKTPMSNIASFSEGTTVQVGLQMNLIPENVEFVAIPYVSAQ